MENSILKVKSLFKPDGIVQDALIAWDRNGKIAYAGPENGAPELDGQIFNFNKLTAIPGLIDIHVHGGWGINFGVGDLEAGLSEYSQKVLSSGVTRF